MSIEVFSTAINHEWSMSDPQIVTLEEANRLLGKLDAFPNSSPTWLPIRMHITKGAGRNVQPYRGHPNQHRRSARKER